MMMKMIVVMAAIFFSGCAHVISEDLLKEVNMDINFAELRKNPLTYQGEVVLLGGVIVKVMYKQDRTLFKFTRPRWIVKRGR